MHSLGRYMLQLWKERATRTVTSLECKLLELQYALLADTLELLHNSEKGDAFLIWYQYNFAADFRRLAEKITEIDHGKTPPFIE